MHSARFHFTPMKIDKWRFVFMDLIEIETEFGSPYPPSPGIFCVFRAFCASKPLN